MSGDKFDISRNKKYNETNIQKLSEEEDTTICIQEFDAWEKQTKEMLPNEVWRTENSGLSDKGWTFNKSEKDIVPTKMFKLSSILKYQFSCWERDMPVLFLGKRYNISSITV